MKSRISLVDILYAARVALQEVDHVAAVTAEGHVDKKGGIGKAACHKCSWGDVFPEFASGLTVLDFENECTTSHEGPLLCVGFLPKYYQDVVYVGRNGTVFYHNVAFDHLSY